MPGMLCHEADLSLRGPNQFVRPRVSWPCEGRDNLPIAVFLAETESGLKLADTFCTEAGFLVLAVRTADLEVAVNAVEWAADHGHQLGGDPDQLVVAGGRLAAAVALHARAEGWPALSRLVLIGTGLARWARRLRDADVEVDEVGSDAAMSSGWIHGLRK
jgi:hypothetical protein